MKINAIPTPVLDRFRRGVVIPALPLALDANRHFSEKHARGLIRYYAAAGVGGLAVGVHSTQFEIRNPEHGLFEPVLQLAAATLDEISNNGGTPLIKIAGVCGETRQAIAEATLARQLGYHAGLLSLGALKKAPLDDLLAHCRAVAEVLPVIGFYLQPSVGGRLLSYDFWRRFAEIPNVLGIKISPFNRYQSLDVIRAVCDAERDAEISLYTGNDDNIIVDLLSEYRIATPNGPRRARIVGGLLGHWAVWTRRAVEQLEQCHTIVDNGTTLPAEMLRLANEVTDCNAAFFDVANAFAGCIPGIHEVLRRQGLLPGTWCLNPQEVLSAGQSAEIDRVYAAYPHLNDDEFVAANLAAWLS